MHSESDIRDSKDSNNSPGVAKPVLVFTPDEHVSRLPQSVAKELCIPAREINSKPAEKSQTHSMSHFRNKFREQGFSENVASVIVASWKEGTHKQYESIIGKWKEFCSWRSLPYNEASISGVTEFLMEQYQRGLSASAIGTYRSALSNYLPKVDGCKVGEHEMVVRFVKGIKNKRPSVPRYTTTWDTDGVIKFLKEYDDSKLKQLTLKLTMILALITAQRAQTLSKLKIGEMENRQGSLVFRIGESLKTKAPGTAIVELKEFKLDDKLCPVQLVKRYIDKTKDIRTDDTLIISFVKPHRAVHVDTIRRWITMVMQMAGVDVNVYKPHSTRAASTSKAKEKQVPLENIMKAAMWSQSSTFATYYDKVIDSQENEVTVSDAVLNVE